LEWKNDGVMDDKSGDDDTGEVRRSWRRDESGRGRSRRGWLTMQFCVPEPGHMHLEHRWQSVRDI